MPKFRSSTFFWAFSTERLTHGVLDGFVFLHAEALECFEHEVAGEEFHEVIFEREVEAGFAGIALAAGATAELVVDAACLVAFGAEHVEAAGFGDGVAKFDVGAAAGHVGGDGDAADGLAGFVDVALSGEDDDVGFALVVFGVENFVLDAVAAHEHLREAFGFFDAGGADEDGLAAFVSIP